MERYLIDTNVVCDFFLADLPENGMILVGNAINAIPNLSIISQIELLCWKTTAETEQKIREFINESNVFGISNGVIQHCVNIRRAKKVKTPDTIIAATALVQNFTLLTRNTSDFNNITGLTVKNPHNL